MARPRANLRQFEAEIVRLHQAEHWSMEMIARAYHVSRSAIHKFLRALGIDTSKAASWVATQCSYCEAPVQVRRATYRRIKHHFCHQDHYVAWMNLARGRLHSQQERSAAWQGYVASIHGELPTGSVVHHKDKNNYNNDPGNLMLFACHSDHLRWHRDKREGIVPLWSG